MKARVTFVLLAWLSAFVTVTALFLVVPNLKDVPLALRALAISGVLTIVMTQVAIPLIQRLLRSTGRSPAKR
jgi:antibiotic biosynthesis monooxygenase (ABM) superfamily enzyme